MNLHLKINEDLKTAMRDGNQFIVDVLRFLLSALHNKEIEKKGKGLEPGLLDNEIIEVLTKEAKKRKEAVEIYQKGGREDLVHKENQELEVIKKYLPEELSREEIEKIVIGIIKKVGATEMRYFGRVMKEAASELKGKAEASVIIEIVKKNLESKI
jgi:hypothetical protein